MLRTGLPAEQGLYHPQFEHDACGIGFVADVQGCRSNAIVRQALAVLLSLAHRGATGAEPNTGDGAGILLQLPHAFLQQVGTAEGIELPAAGDYGVGMVFLPQEPAQRRLCEERLEAIIREEGQQFLGWRTVPTDNRLLGETARAAEPCIRQVFIGRSPALAGGDAFERKLYVIRKRAENGIRYGDLPGGERFYLASLSGKTIVYKGMLLATQLESYYPDLADPAVETALALVHSRFSTNTFPSWERAHPNRVIIHNGEINTLRGNVNWMHARQAQFASPLFGDDLANVLPVIHEDGSDSAMFDNCLEFLVLAGRSLPHAVMMMIPEPWSKHETMDDDKLAFYQYHSCLMEPWDGPAAMAFTDGVRVGAVLDRNGLRPARYLVTHDGLVVMASEAGVLDIAPEQVKQKGRLQPGRMLLVDTAAGRIISDEEIKRDIATAEPYQPWLDQHLLSLADLPPRWPPGAPLAPGGSLSIYGASQRSAASSDAATVASEDATSSGGREGPPLTLVQRQQAFGYTFEDLRLIMAPMAKNGVEPVGSMGDDTPLAVLSHKPQPLYNYFRQLFAQVTNPPIDANREELVTSTEVLLGPEGNLLAPRPEDCRRLRLETPILTNEELASVRAATKGRGVYASVQVASDSQTRQLANSHTPLHNFCAVTLPILFPVEEGEAGLREALVELWQAADRAMARGANLLILSDRAVDRRQAAVPALLAVAGLHHHLVRQGTRTQVSLLLESGEPREVHHFAVLLGYGADAINPYLAFETLGDMVDRQMLTGIDREAAVHLYVKSIVKGVVKVISKMGISTVQSYRGAQIFEALGLHRRVVDDYFTGTPSRIGGVGLDVLAKEVCIRHRQAFPDRPANGHTLEEGGRYQWRHDGEHHLFNPATVHRLQRAVRSGDYATYQQYAAAVNEQAERLCTLRGLLELNCLAEPIPLEEVEPVEAIVRRFKSGAMSYGSISQEAHETLAIAMNRLGGKSNTGEGGEDPARYTPDANGDSRNSAIKQVASGRFGVTSHYLVQARELQIKMAQGAKPGEGGQLPGHKVYPWIARVRYATPGVGLISPPPHHDIYSIEDLAQLIYDLKNANQQARISVKLVSEVGVGTIAAGVAKGHADVILISGHDGGTGASPQTSIKHAGLPWELGLAETQQTLLLNSLRSRVVLETDGQLKTGRDVVIAALLGAEEFGFATAPLVALGCIMMRVCHLDTCPVGVATQNPELRRKFTGDPEHVVNFMRFVAKDVREWMARLGFRTVEEMVGRSDKLAPRRAVDHWKARGLDFSQILYQPAIPSGVGRTGRVAQDHGLDKALDNQVLLALCRPALAEGRPVQATLPISNTHRAVGTILGSEVTRRFGPAGLPEDTIELHFQGAAGQSFGAFIPPGVTLILEGEANDYLGKGLSGGKIVVTPPAGAGFVPEENVIIGNVAFYGATAGEAYIYGVAGERFCVRNSGLQAVVEAVGDHGCEYMTGGRVVVLGPTGRNFAAGMSGGVAYVLDEAGDFHRRCNQEMVTLERLEGMSEADKAESDAVQDLIWRHALHTGSRRAWHILAAWDQYRPCFVKVMPRDYQRMLQAIAQAERDGLSGDEAIMAAFEANKRDVARVGGN
ncbi:MAG: glutamate synthase large subunit [Chloroflexi bacterium]|nr:glutamate synthase large subunit [Chloroflexota bacterium]MCI0580969.1 glutamate synthase large subunit [Chloroflexota bacterium]MCI0645359.1 glutamate synthase large subunit [Chloroflexota bacterium]MCI0729301.1 glutamate synthase large subunit [Chloroflexota bacterium]